MLLSIGQFLSISHVEIKQLHFLLGSELFLTIILISIFVLMSATSKNIIFGIVKKRIFFSNIKIDT